MPVTLVDWKPLVRNSLRGFATIRLGRSLTIKDVTVHSSHGKSWASLPSKPMVGRDGVAMKDGEKIRYVPILEWADKDSQNRFSEAVTAAIEAAHPGAIGG